MPWKRGTGSLEVELSSLQGWAERVDLDLYGPNGDTGEIGVARRERAKQEQHELEMAKLYSIIKWLFVVAGSGLGLEIARAFGWIK
jgi:hypothetical protein